MVGRPPGGGGQQMHSMRGMPPTMGRGGQVRPRGGGMPLRTNQAPLVNGERIMFKYLFIFLFLSDNHKERNQSRKNF